MQALTANIMKHVMGLPEGEPVSAKALLHLGSRAAVDQSLSRLARRKQLMRAGRGLYVRPVQTRFGMRPPSISNLVQGLASLKGEIIASHGAAAANALGLTTQVPVRSVFLTSGRSRLLKVGEQVVELRHAPAWQLVMAERPAGEAIRALAWLGEEYAGEALLSLRDRLPSQEIENMANARFRLPTWLAEQISKVGVNG